MDKFTEVKSSGGVVYMTAPNISAVHGFTTRWGGVSTGIYESLNLAQNSDDDRSCVTQNYERLGRAMGFSAKDLVCTRQVHEAQVRIVTSADSHAPFEKTPYEADGLVTNQPGVPLIIFTADCVPILLSDPDSGVISAVHSGWRGTAAGIAANAVSAMTKLGAVPENIQAAIGPCISSCCFETGPEVPAALMKIMPQKAEMFIRPGYGDRTYVDLKGANREILMRAGLAFENISLSGECTSCMCDKYWSHRKTKGRRGSQASVIML